MEWRDWITWWTTYSGDFKYIFKKHEIVTDNLSIMIYVSKIEKIIAIKIKTGYYLELLMPENYEINWKYYK